MYDVPFAVFFLPTYFAKTRGNKPVDFICIHCAARAVESDENCIGINAHVILLVISLIQKVENYWQSYIKKEESMSRHNVVFLSCLVFSGRVLYLKCDF